MASWTVSGMAGAARYSLTLCSLFPLWEKLQAEKASLGTSLCHLREGVTGKVKLFVLPSLMHVFSIFFFFLLQWCAGTSLLDYQTPTKVLFLFTGCCQN